MSRRTRARHFTQEASDSILSTLEPITSDQREIAFDTLANIFELYTRADESKHYMPDIDEHRERLSSIVAAAKKLETLLANERLASALVTWQPYIDEHGGVQDLMGHPRVPEARNRERTREGDLDIACAILKMKFVDTLRLIQKQGLTLVADDKTLRDWRGSAEGGAEHKSVERRTIWEPMFSLWTACGKPLGAARKGKMFRALTEIHNSLGLSPPNPETLYRAIIEWKRKG